MKSFKNILVLVLIFTNHLMFSQIKLDKNNKPIIKSSSDKNKHSELTLYKRLNSNPFYKTSSIMLVSFNLKFNDDIQIEKITDSLKIKDFIKDGEIDDFSKILNHDNSDLLSKINQKKLLNLKEIIDLTDILFNTCSRHKINHFNEIGCYYPRNAILFLDNNNNIIDYIEICFECRKIKTSSLILKQKEICDFLLSDLETYFNKIGIKTKYEKTNQ